MFLFDRWQFPDGETHLPKRMMKGALRVDGRLTYQYPLYQQGLARCLGRDVAVDVGAHVGLFSYWMVRDFAKVIAFEPVNAHRECWRANVPMRPQDELFACALGAKKGAVEMRCVPGSSGGTFVGGAGTVELAMLDSFGIGAIDLLKIDCEGYELEVVMGATETIARCHPVVIVEQRPKMTTRAGHGNADAVTFLSRLGAHIAWTDRRDYVLTFARTH